MSNLKLPPAIQRMARLGKMFESESYKIFMADNKKCMEDWQYHEPIDMGLEDRFDLDREAYINTFYNEENYHSSPLAYDESVLLKKLIKNLKKAIHPYYIDYRNYLKHLLKEKKNSLEHITNKSETLHAALNQYGFNKLPKIKELNSTQIRELISIISKNKSPYQIAMLDFLGFIEHFTNEYTNTNGERDKLLALILVVDARSIRGNINSLRKKSQDKRAYYTSCQHIETVKKDFSNL